MGLVCLSCGGRHMAGVRTRGPRAAGLHGIELSGFFLLSFSRACVNLNAIIGDEMEKLVQGVDPQNWLPANSFLAALDLIADRYPQFEPILERIGMEMMRLWYEFGPGRSIVKKAIDFLHFQTGSGGYASVVRGPAEGVGRFSLESIDPESGMAIVYSTTPFERAMERGILLGGLQLAGDAIYVDIDNSKDENRFLVTWR